MRKIRKDYDMPPEAEFGVDSRYSSEEERISEGKLLMKARRETWKQFTPADLMQARLVQLKLQMDAFLNGHAEEYPEGFLGFLKAYIDSLYTKRKHFAADIGLTPVELSHVINGRREPKLEFLLRLMLHSEKIYEHIFRFDKEIWFRVYYHEKINVTLSRQDHWQPKEEIHVNISEPYERYGKTLGN